MEESDSFGTSITSLGDLNNDGIVDIAVGPSDDDGDNAGNAGVSKSGAVWILFLNADGTVKNHQKISNASGNFTGDLDGSDNFGAAVTKLGDLDGDGNTDLAVGSIQDDDGGRDVGAVWILFLNSDGTVKNHQKISQTEGDFTGGLEKDDQFGSSIASLGDMDGDGIADLVVGARNGDRGKPQSGAVWILLLTHEGKVKRHLRIGDDIGILVLQSLPWEI